MKQTFILRFSSQSPSPTPIRSTITSAKPTQYASVKVEITRAIVDRPIQKRRRYLDVEESDKAPT